MCRPRSAGHRPRRAEPRAPAELILKYPMPAFELSILGNQAARVVSGGDQDHAMKFPRPTGWLLGFSCIAPAIAALMVDAVIRSFELMGAFKNDPLAAASTAGGWTFWFCVGGSLLSAVWLNRKRSLVVTLIYWGSLTVLNLALTIPGCSFLWR